MLLASGGNRECCAASSGMYGCGTGTVGVGAPVAGYRAANGATVAGGGATREGRILAAAEGSGDTNGAAEGVIVAIAGLSFTTGTGTAAGAGVTAA